MKLVDLFCGCGGLALGAHQAGFEVATAYDIDHNLTYSYQRNFPATRLLIRDVSTLTGDELRHDVGAHIDGIFGGPPCQGFSSIGLRDARDPRRQLLGHFFRLIAEAKPTFFVMENVKGLVYSDAKPLLDEALALLGGVYTVLGPHVLDASNYGAATKRPRVFVIGVHKDRAEKLTLEDLERQRTPPANVYSAIHDLAEAMRVDDDCGYDVWQFGNSGSVSDYARSMRDMSLMFTGHSKTLHNASVVSRFADLPPGAVDKVGRHPRLAWEGLCPTLRAGTGADRGSFQSVRPIHPVENRVITVREAARLQGFPDAHRFHPTVWHSFRMIGNSVSPPMARAIFTAIRAKLNADIQGSVAAE